MREKNVLDEKSKNILLDSIRTINDYTKPGIIFKDITTLLNNKNAFNFLMDHLEERYKSYNLDYVTGVE
ncbi:adenine phosphoribosyltransferase, partial [Aliarcobacter butzleri]